MEYIENRVFDWWRHVASRWSSRPRYIWTLTSGKQVKIVGRCQQNTY